MILTKGGTHALADLDLYRRDRDAFFTTLTSLDDRFSLKWEPGAPLPGNRIEAIKKFHSAGIFTIVSLEPTLDIEHSLAVVEATYGFVDLYSHRPGQQTGGADQDDGLAGLHRADARLAGPHGERALHQGQPARASATGLPQPPSGAAASLSVAVRPWRGLIVQQGEHYGLAEHRERLAFGAGAFMTALRRN